MDYTVQYDLYHLESIRNHRTAQKRRFGHGLFLRIVIEINQLLRELRNKSLCSENLWATAQKETYVRKE